MYGDVIVQGMPGIVINASPGTVRGESLGEAEPCEFDIITRPYRHRLDDGESSDYCRSKYGAYTLAELAHCTGLSVASGEILTISKDNVLNLDSLKVKVDGTLHFEGSDVTRQARSIQVQADATISADETLQLFMTSRDASQFSIHPGSQVYALPHYDTL